MVLSMRRKEEAIRYAISSVMILGKERKAAGGLIGLVPFPYVERKVPKTYEGR